MAYQTLYRKYRPKSFSLVFGQDVITKTLKNVIKNNKLSHAYLFSGPRGTGKTSCAKLFAKAINCLNPKDGDACNECENCKSFNENANPDIIEIDAASNNGVDEIREIKNKVNLVPSMSKYKVYIIDEVHMLSIGAFNALLKTLEEPPEYVIFILATTEPQKIPATIISRCQRFDFKSISPKSMKECLKNIIEKEKITITDDALDEIIVNSKGGMRDAISLLDQAYAFCDEKITLNDIESLSGNITLKELISLFLDIIEKNYDNISNKINTFYSSGKDISLICEKMVNFIRNGILYKKNIVKNVLDDDKNIYDRLSEQNMYIIVDFLSDTLTKLQKYYQKNITFEVQLIKLIDILNTNALRETKEESKNNVPRETSYEENKNNVPRETSSEKNKSNVPRETLDNKNFENISKIKEIRINNILLEATKNDINFINELWQNINDYLINDKYKISAGILENSKPVAASKTGIIITLPLDSLVNRVEKIYDNSKDLLKEILNNNYKLVYISSDYWSKIRPIYAKKVKNKELQYIDEKQALDELKSKQNNNLLNEFGELIEMEEF